MPFLFLYMFFLSTSIRIATASALPPKPARAPRPRLPSPRRILPQRMQRRRRGILFESASSIRPRPDRWCTREIPVPRRPYRWRQPTAGPASQGTAAQLPLLLGFRDQSPNFFSDHFAPSPRSGPNFTLAGGGSLRALRCTAPAHSPAPAPAPAPATANTCALLPSRLADVRFHISSGKGTYH